MSPFEKISLCISHEFFITLSKCPYPLQPPALLTGVVLGRDGHDAHGLSHDVLGEVAHVAPVVLVDTEQGSVDPVGPVHKVSVDGETKGVLRDQRVTLRGQEHLDRGGGESKHVSGKLERVSHSDTTPRGDHSHQGQFIFVVFLRGSITSSSFNCHVKTIKDN